MRKAVLVLLGVALVGVTLSATYNTATIRSVDPVTSGGSIHVTVTCTGNNGEPPVIVEVNLQGGIATAAEFRSQVWNACDAADRTNAASKLLAVGANVPRPATVTPPTPTAFEIWRAKAIRLQRLRALALSDSTALAEIDALSADVNATYAAGYAASF